MTMQLREMKLIDKLIVKRTELIECYTQSIELQKQALKHVEAIDKSIPETNASYPMVFEVVFINLAQSMGESGKGRSLPSISTMTKLTKGQIEARTTKIVDTYLWECLYNRLGILSLMSEKQVKAFHKDNNESPIAFTLENVEGSFESIRKRANDLIFEGLIDTITSVDNSYINNNRFEFTKRIIIKNAFYEYGDSFKLSSPSPLQQILRYVWQITGKHAFKCDENGVGHDNVWETLASIVRNCKGDASLLQSVNVADFELRFFNNKNVHLLMSDRILSELNKGLASTGYLKHAA